MGRILTLMKREPAQKLQAGGWLGPRPFAQGLGRSRDISASRPAVEIYGWQIHKKPLSIKIPIHVVEKMQDDIRYGLGMSTPCDVLGFLIGRLSTGYSSTVTVHDYELAGYTSESVGPGFWNNDRLAKMIKSWTRPNSSLYVVGFFRSQSGKWPEIEKEDLKGAKRLLKRTPNVFLLIRSGLDRSYAGRLFLRPSWRAKVDEEYGEFPLNADILRAQWGATEQPSEATSLHFVPGNPLQERHRLERAKRAAAGAEIEAIFERVEEVPLSAVANSGVIAEASASTNAAPEIVLEAPAQPTVASQFTEAPPLKDSSISEPAEVPKRNLWNKLFRPAAAQSLPVEPVATEATPEVLSEAPQQAPREWLWENLSQPATEEAPRVEPIAAEAIPQVPLWPGADQALPVEPLAAEATPEVAVSPNVDQSLALEPVAAETTPNAPFWKKLFRRATDQALPVEPIVAEAITEVAQSPSADRSLPVEPAAAEAIPNVMLSADRSLPVEPVAAEAIPNVMLSEDQALPVEPVAAEAITQVPQSPSADRSLPVEPAAAEAIPNVMSSADRSLPAEPVAAEATPNAPFWKKLFRRATDQTLPVELVAAEAIPNAMLSEDQALPVEPVAAETIPNAPFWKKLFRRATDQTLPVELLAAEATPDAMLSEDQALPAEPVAAEAGVEQATVEPFPSPNRAEAENDEYAEVEGEDEFQGGGGNWSGENPPPPPGRSWRSWLAIAATWIIAAGVTLWWMDGRNLYRHHAAPVEQTRPVTVSGPIGLQLDRAGGLLEIIWDRNSDTVANSQGGYLTIRDGGEVKEIQLNPSDIQTGHLYYGPNSSDLGIRLELSEQDGETASESIRVVGPPSPARRRSNQ